VGVMFVLTDMFRSPITNILLIVIRGIKIQLNREMNFNSQTFGLSTANPFFNSSILTFIFLPIVCAADSSINSTKGKGL
jgi:hypothetical protein